ncbi:MAG: NAD(P)-dependent oxidoreductase [Myxococcales bacterium]|nr:NAD(P)-dependent oxidoreductase [Myxococcales bacterium]
MRVFVAGATGATGRVFCPLATAAGLELLLHVRPQSAATTAVAADARARVFDLADSTALAEVLVGADAVLSLVGTMQRRFAKGDTYESSDILSTRQLVAGAVAAGVPRFVLLSSYGAGGAGAYLTMKGECEAIVRGSGLAWAIARPSALVSPAGVEGSDGARTVPWGVEALGAALRSLPGLRGVVDDLRPMPLEVLSRALVGMLAEPGGRVVAGRGLWELGSS